MYGHAHTHHSMCARTHIEKTTFLVSNRDVGVVQSTKHCCAIIKEFLNWRLNWNVVINIREMDNIFPCIKRKLISKNKHPLCDDPLK